MPERIARIVLLVEDRNQELLLLRYLERDGQDRRSVRVNKTSAGSGEHHVRVQFAREVTASRTQFAKTKACLIAVIDADVNTCRAANNC